MAFYKLSRMLQPKVVVPPGKERAADVISNSQKLLDGLGLVRSSDGGTTTLLPLAMRSLNKLKTIITNEMEQTGASEIMLSALTPHRLLQKTGRHELPELFKLQDRHGKNFVLSPTHEEAIVNLVASLKPTYKQLPLYLFQITSKFRDEMKPRFGLMRSKEFLMKDLYIFESSVELSRKSYNTVNESYHRLFKKLGVPYLQVVGCPGEIGGSISDEFHVLSAVGEDKITKCTDCGHAENTVTRTDKSRKCRKCGQCNLTEHQAIEVGHSFLLGSRYTQPLNAKFLDENNVAQNLEMSCHGIGITRLLAASIEALSKPNEIRWPRPIAPFSLCFLPPKAGSKEEKGTVPLEPLIHSLSQLFEGDIVKDDRTELTLGKRFLEAKQMGYPYVVIVGKAILDSVPKVELYDTLHETTELLQPNDLTQCIKEKEKMR